MKTSDPFAAAIGTERGSPELIRARMLARQVQNLDSLEKMLEVWQSSKESRTLGGYHYLLHEPLAKLLDEDAKQGAHSLEQSMAAISSITGVPGFSDIDFRQDIIRQLELFSRVGSFDNRLKLSIARRESGSAILYRIAREISYKQFSHLRAALGDEAYENLEAVAWRKLDRVEALHTSGKRSIGRMCSDLTTHRAEVDGKSVYSFCRGSEPHRVEAIRHWYHEKLTKHIDDIARYSV